MRERNGIGESEYIILCEREKTKLLKETDITTNNEDTLMRACLVEEGGGGGGLRVK